MIFEIFLFLRQNAQASRLKHLEQRKRQLEDKITKLEASQREIEQRTSRWKPLNPHPDD